MSKRLPNKSIKNEPVAPAAPATNSQNSNDDLLSLPKNQALPETKPDFRQFDCPAQFPSEPE